MHTSKRWNLAPAHEAAAELAARLKVSPLVAQILLNRGHIEPDDCHKFLKPTLKDLHDPALIAGLSKAADRVARAIRDREKIVVYGDYDVDGITAVTILWHAIKLLGGDVHYYIPHRIDEGYGLNSEAISQICKDGAKLIITVDCGVTAIEPAETAKACGVDLIVSDHHEWKENKDEGGRMKDEKGVDPIHPSSFILHPSPLLPPAYAIVHPRLPLEDGTTYPNPNLCGAGVAFKLAWGIGQAVCGASKVSDEFRSFLIDATALAALGTIADVVPLIGENRILAHFGLGGLKASRLIGIKALIESANLTGQTLDSFHVGFLLGPRLNACGRMGHAALAVEMLTIADEGRAIEIATYLEQQNRERQVMEKTILTAALDQITACDFAGEGNCALVLAGQGWHPGVIGIVASRIVDRFHRPTVMIAINEDGIGQGSARSINGFHLAGALTHCGEHLKSFGGHEMAAGLKIKAGNIDAFRAAFCAVAKQQLTPEQLQPQVYLDADSSLGQINTALVTDLKRLGPFGQGNRKPLLCCRNLTIALPPKRVGKTGDHLQLFLKQGNASMKAIAFNGGRWFDQLTPGKTVDLAVEPTLNEWNGKISVELDVKDLQIQ